MSKIEELLAKYNGNLFDAIQFDEWYKAKISRNEIITYVDYMATFCAILYIDCKHRFVCDQWAYDGLDVERDGTDGEGEIEHGRAAGR